MIFIFDNSIHDLEVIYNYDIDTDEAVPIFTFTNDNGREIIIKYWSIERGGHQQCIKNYQNGQKHGTQYGWYAIQGGGRLSYIENYQNGKMHGTQYEWIIILHENQLCYMHITNYENDMIIH
jgi:antitoxin component YwqK of YwqJK toxin-antitoxin module